MIGHMFHVPRSGTAGIGCRPLDLVRRCKTHARRLARRIVQSCPPLRFAVAWSRTTTARACRSLVQGFLQSGRTRAIATGLAAVLGGATGAQAACPGPAPVLEPLGEGVWRVAALAGEADAANRGQVSNLLLARDGKRLWALGSGPSPAFGRALACWVRLRLGQAITDTVSPWTRPEMVLGAGGLGPVRHWAHEAVAAGMARQCPHCVERLRERLGAAAADLGPRPIALPQRRLRGESGRLGPWRWWLLARGKDAWTTAWRLDRAPLWAAPGLLWGDAPADGRDAEIEVLAASTQALARLAADDGPSARWLGEQGAATVADAAARQGAYWRDLLAQVRAAIERGDAEAAPAPAWDGLDAHWAADARHALNWQRAWRQVETAAFDAAR